MSNSLATSNTQQLLARSSHRSFLHAYLVQKVEPIVSYWAGYAASVERQPHRSLNIVRLISYCFVGASGGLLGDEVAHAEARQRSHTLGEQGPSYKGSAVRCP